MRLDLCRRREEGEGGWRARGRGSVPLSRMEMVQGQCRLSGAASLLGLEVSGFSMWHFLKLVVRGSLRVFRFPPLLHWLMVQPIK